MNQRPEMPETPEARIKRMTMRSARRGTKEMDLVLGPFARARLSQMSQQELDLYDRLLEENDHELYRWVTGQSEANAPYRQLIEDISAFIHQ